MYFHKLIPALVAMLGLIQLFTAGHVQASTIGVPSDAWKEVRQGISSTWSSSCKCPSPIKISFCVSDDGKIYEPELDHPSGEDQYDAECLEAICGLSPVSPDRGNYTTRLSRCSFTFGSSVPLSESPATAVIFNPKPKYDGSDVKAYLSTHSQALRRESWTFPSSFVLVHRIPLSVLFRYPGLFTEQELRSPNNLIEIPFMKEDWTLHHLTVPFVRPIGNLYAYWANLFKRAEVTKEDILDWAKGAERWAN